MPDDKTIDFVVVFILTGLVVLGLGSWLVGWLAKQWDRFVNRSAIVMSRSDDDSSPIAASSLQTDARQTPDRPMIPKPTPEQWLTLYILMRRHGIKRDDAGAAFRAAGLSLDNNTWSKAQPPEPEQVTPIAGRPTDADFPYESIGQ